MAESVISSAIERLDSWLLKKPDFFEENYGKLHSLLVDKADLCSPPFEMADMRNDIKEKLYDMLVGKTDFGEDNNKKLYNFLAGIGDFTEDNMDKLHKVMIEMGDFNFLYETELYNLSRRFLIDYKEELYNLLVGMADFTDNNNEKMKSLLVGMADFWEENNKEKLYNLLVWVAVLPDSHLYKNKRIVNNKKNVYSLLVEMTELWEDDEKDELNKEKLHTLLLEITGLRVDEYMIKRYDKELYLKKVYCLMEDIADLCKNVKGKLNKVKLHRWLAKKAMLWEHGKLFRLLLDVAFHRENKDASKFKRNKVEGIRGELRWILDFLRDKKWEEGSRLHCFVSDAVEMAHDAQLLIDFRDSDPFIIFLIFNREDHAFIEHDENRLMKKMDDIQNWIQETKEHMLKFRVERGITKSQNVGGGEGVVVGLEKDIKLLLGIKNKHTIIIKGMAGIGKTTLARLLYDHAKIVDKFECRAWVCASWESSRKEILIKLIQQLVDSNEFERGVGCLEEMNNRGLKQMLHQHLEGVRYFIVLDDVWEKTLLEYVLNTLPSDKGRSRLLLTTCNAEIARDSRTTYDHKMKYLDDDESWQLFLKTLFSGTSTDQEFPKHLVKRGRKMLARCNGLPLAIKEVGRKWAEKRELMSEWEQLVESIDLSETLEALESTYNNLDTLVKSCFLHLSFFKEGTPIRWKKLRNIWTVRGVVEEKGIYAKKFKDELEKASIIVEAPEDGRISCHVNTVFHKLSIKKVEEEIGLEILRNDGNNQVSDNSCHRVIYCSREKFIFSTTQNNSHLVSLFFHGGGYFDDSPSYWKHFEKLEIIDMEDFGLKILPDAVGMLIELRYLGLRNNYIQELPHSLGQLKNLEVLDIALNFMMEVPNIIWELGSLQHLYMSDVICQSPIKISAMTNLQTLAYISVDNWVCEFSGSEMFSCLTKLGIEELDMNSDISKLFASLAKLRYLGVLVLRGFCYRSMPCLDELGVLQNLYQLKLEGRLTRLPGANNFPPEIRRLTLVDSSLEEDPMPTLENLSNLYYLKLQNAYTGRKMVISSKGFPMIFSLVIEDFWNLRTIQVAKHGMCNLRSVDVNSCPYLETPVKDINGNHSR